MAKARIVIRADGNHSLGMGHIYRTLNLAEALNVWADIVFLTKGDVTASKKLSERLPTRIVHNEKGEYAAIDSEHPDVIVVDKLDTEVSYMRKLKEKCDILVSFDDCGDGVFEADLAFNVLYSKLKHLKPGSSTRFYTDPTYVVINPRFAETSEKRENDPPQILITLGGADTLGLASSVIEILDTMPDRFDMTTVIGPAFKHYVDLERTVGKIKKNIEINFNVTNMWEIMARSDLSISAGGNTLFELAATGTPAVVICEELFEVETANRLQAFDTCVNLGYSRKVDRKKLRRAVSGLINDKEKRREMSIAGRKLVDGRGSERVSKLIQEAIVTTLK